jgi:steroid 5-alpha reductase family enzyme
MNILTKVYSLIPLLQMAWSTRLTGNTLRRGFFNPFEEDYRWPIVRNRLPRWLWVLLDLSFVSFTQIFLLASTAVSRCKGMEEQEWYADDVRIGSFRNICFSVSLRVSDQKHIADIQNSLHSCLPPIVTTDTSGMA